MIEEDYVSFEIAKLLKEKGFNEPCIGFYNPIDGCFFETSIRKSWNYNQHGSINAPTLQMAMKWLREVHHLHITVFSSSQESWMYRITKPHQTLKEGCYGEDYASNEEACEAAIKYCLDNIIAL